MEENAYAAKEGGGFRSANAGAIMPYCGAIGKLFCGANKKLLNNCFY